MRAIAVDEFGAQPRMVDLPVPEAGPGQVQVRLAAASMNPMDAAAAQGRFARFGEHRLPLILGFDGAGTVTAVGGGVADLAVGDRVFGQFWTSPIGQGTYAEYTVIDAHPANGSIALVPGGLPLSQAAALPTAASTALGAVETAGVGQGDTLLVIGATGGVGVFAVQVAARLGVRVIATAAADAAALVRDLGAAETIDYKAGSLEEGIVAAAPGGLDGVVDLTGNRESIAAAARHLRDGAAVVSIAFGVSEQLQADPRVRAVNYALDRKGERLEEVARLAGEKAIVPVIDTEISLEDALARSGNQQDRGNLGAGARGKTVIRISEQDE